MNQLNEQQLQLHVPIVGWLLIVGHVIFLVAAGFVFLLLTSIGVAVRDVEASSILFIVATAVAALLGLLAIPGLVAGFGLLARKNWARILAIVVAILGLLNFPLGTLIGLYAIWVLLQDAATGYFTQHNPDLETMPKPAA
jgi:hypothetical protein